MVAVKREVADHKVGERFSVERMSKLTATSHCAIKEAAKMQCKERQCVVLRTHTETIIQSPLVVLGF